MPEEPPTEEKALQDFSVLLNEFAGLQKGEIFKLIFQPDFDERARDMCLQCTGEMCNSLFLPFAGLDTDTDIDTFIVDLMNAFPGKRKLERMGDVIHYDFYPDVKGECQCPIITLKHLEPTPLWCRCGNYFNKTMFEAVVKHSVQVELLDSPLATGSDFCRRLIHLKSPASTAGVPKADPTKVSQSTLNETRAVIERILASRRDIEVEGNKTVKKLIDELQIPIASVLLEVNGEIFYPDGIKDRILTKDDRVAVLPLIAGG